MNTKKIKKKLVDNNQEVENLRQQLVRLLADFENYRRRADSQKLELIKFSNAELINQFLPVLDNFKRAAQHAPQTQDENYNNWVVGMKAIEKQLEDVLRQNGLEE